MNVDLPTPGTPEIPMRTDRFACGVTKPSNSLAGARSSGRDDSINVIARASARRSPLRSRSASSRGRGLVDVSVTSSSVSLLFEFENRLVDDEALAFLRKHLGDDDVFVRPQAILHLHGLDDSQFLAGLDIVARLGAEPNQQTGHR